MQEWRDFFLLLATETDSAELAEALAELAERVGVLESEGGEFSLIGLGSVQVVGPLEGGVYRVELKGDSDDPGPTWYYGTGPDGVRGFLRMSDAFSAGVGIVKTESGYVVLGEVDTVADLPGTGNPGEAWRVVAAGEDGLYAWDGAAFTLDPAADGIVGFRLAELADTGIGAALVKTTRDAYGRVEGTESATTDDLSEGATNLYFPEAPIDGTPYARQDAGWVAAGGGGMTNPMTTLGDIITADTGGVPKRIPVGANGKVLTVVSGEPAWATGGASGNGAVGATFDGGGAALTPGVFTDVFVPFNCTIVGATLLADTTGNLVVSVLADPYASFPPTTDLAPTTPPTISGSDKSQDTTLSGWSTAIAAGDVVRLGVVSCSSITRATLSLEVTKT